MTTYRGAYLDHGTECTILTGPEHAALSDDELRAEALAEAHRGRILGEAPGLSLQDFQALLMIGELAQ